MKTRTFIAAILMAISCFGLEGRTLKNFTIIQPEKLSDSLSIAVSDLDKYIRQSVIGAKTCICRSRSNDGILPEGHVIVIADRNDKNIDSLCSKYALDKSPSDWNSFSISSFQRTDEDEGNVYFLQGADLWGWQYAIYDLAERLLGVRYLKPEIDFIPTHKNFNAQLINTGILKCDYKWRGLYPWHYNYNSRGLNTFCDINTRFTNKDWTWFRQLADWMVKNKQNTVLWFDDVFSHENISGQFPDEVNDYFALRGIRQILGLGWASNEDLYSVQGWENIFCTDKNGKSVEDADWKRAICPMHEKYFNLADENFRNLNLDKKDNYLGLLIGYAENTWASREKGVGCIRHKGEPSSHMMIRDLKYVTDKMDSLGLGHLPVGFVTSTHSIRPGNPFETDFFIENLPQNAIFSMHTYQQSGWEQFDRLYCKIQQKNNESGYNIKSFQISEVAFLCNSDIPLLKPSILRRRSEHFNTLPKENTIGHLTTLNTTQHLYWYNSYQQLQWQWHKDSRPWNEYNEENMVHLFGKKQGRKISEIFDRLCCLEYVLLYSSIDSLKNSTPSLLPPEQWKRYNPSTHKEDFGFLLWANVKDPDMLEDAEKSVEKILKMSQDLVKDCIPLYKDEFHSTVCLTAHYYAIRVAMGKYNYYKEHQNEKQASIQMEKARKNLAAYNSYLNIENERDYVINPRLHEPDTGSYTVF